MRNGLAAVPSSDRMRVLVADDDRFFAEMLRVSLLQHDGFNVVGVASDGVEALTQVEALRPALVVMDVAMPRLDGIEATRRIRALGDPPIVILIIDEAEPLDGRAFQAGAAAYLRKSHDLVGVIDVAVALSQITAMPM